MSRHGNGLAIGSFLFVLLLVALPYLLLALSGWPGDVSVENAVLNLGVIGPIAAPPPPLGPSPRMVHWQLLLAGLGLGIGLGLWLGIVSLGKGVLRQGMPANARFWLLALCGAASLAAYGLNFLLPFPLLRYYSVRLGTMGVIAVRDAGIALSVTTATIALFLFYGLAYALCRGQNDRRLWAIVLVGVLLYAVITVLAFPISSLDIYDYIARGRITGVHGGNPYVRTTDEYSFDPFMGYAAWQGATSPYGPLWETLVGILARLAGNRLLPNLLAFKGLALMGYAASVLLIAAILRRTAPGRALAGTLLFAWNPLVMFEAMSNAHNDALVVALLLGAFWILSLYADRMQGAAAQKSSPDERFWKRMYGGMALILVGAAVLTKLIPLLFFPPFLLFLLADERGWWRRIGVGWLLLIPVLLLAIEYYRVFWHWPEVFNTVLRQATMFRMSIPSVTKEALQQYVGEARAQVLVRPFLGVFALAYLVVLGRATYALNMLPQRGPLAAVSRFLFGGRQTTERRPWDILTGASLSIYLLYLLLGNFWFWPWYLILPVALLALAGDERLFVSLLLAACAGEISHVGWNFVWYWWGVSWDTLYRMDALVVFFMVVPALVVYAINLRRGLPPDSFPP